MKTAVASSLLISSMAQAAFISPVELVTSLARPVASFTVENDGLEPIAYQAEGRAWRQVNGENTEIASDDIIITPPIVTIAAGSKQVFRVGLSKKVDTNKEQTYRVYLEDISEIGKVKTKNESSISFKFNHSLPLFINSNLYTSKPSLSKCATSKQIENCIRVNNYGDKHIKVFGISTTGNNLNKSTLEVSSRTTVLANSWIEYKFKRLDSIKIFHVMTSDGEINVAADDLK